jgi:hypothetical protein
MKEINPPHNDWWTVDDKFELGLFTLDTSAAQLFQRASGASNLSQQVKRGIDELVTARGEKVGPQQTLKHRLRSLFTTMEVNLVADAVPYKERQKRQEPVEIPLSFFVDSRLVDSAQTPVRINVEVYEKALKEVGSKFTDKLLETHYAFNVPARSYIDNQIIDSLIKQGLLDDELVADVLAVDFTTPVFSTKRSSLIRFVPANAKTVNDVRTSLIDVLGKEPETNAAAKELLANLTIAERTAAFHRNRAVEYLDVCRQEAKKLDVVIDWLKVASQRRVEVLASETASSTKGNILERGFRLVFPTDAVKHQPGGLRLQAQTARAVSENGD